MAELLLLDVRPLVSLDVQPLHPLFLLELQLERIGSLQTVMLVAINVVLELVSNLNFFSFDIFITFI